VRGCSWPIPGLYDLILMSMINAFQSNPALLVAACSVLGLLIGSFLNVVIHRLPKMLEQDWDEQAADHLEQRDMAESAKKLRGQAKPRFNLFLPPSACPKCGHRIRAYENVPVFSYLFLRGRCASCKARINIRYPIIETASGIVAGYVAWRFGFSLATLGTLFFAWALIALTVIDIDTQLLPDDITLPLLWLGLLVNLNGTLVPLPEAVIGAAAGYLSLWVVYWLFKLATRKEGMGYGDFKLLAALGAWLGWKMLPVIILLSSVVGAVVGIALIVLARRGRDIPIPFGPYLAAAGLIALFWGDSINRAYLGFL
jgi:leader peptidase (prepilin peptidase) / N-methyltransferase